MHTIATLNPASAQAAAISGLFSGILIFMLAIFAVVATLIAVALVRFRARAGAADPAPVYGWTALEIGWTTVPLLSLVVVFAFTVRGMRAGDPSTAGRAPDLVIVGHQWWWEARYPASGAVAANEIHIPTGRRLVVELRAADVIHDFWVPELGRKMDAIPGHPNRFTLEADRAGEFEGGCAEFCGVEHAWMRIKVVAQTPEAFSAWERAQLAAARAPVGVDAMLGERLFADRTCINCHAIEGTTATQAVGPDLTHIAGRSVLAAGAASMSQLNLERWLKDPDSIKPATHMPNFQLSDADAHAIASYLAELK
jgi:cytochrome c oxidase subunit 2